jgi:nucleoside transporter
MDSSQSLVRTRLSLMMFFEYFIWSAWFPLAGYMPVVLGFSGKESAWIMSTTALGCIVSPLLVGLIADRYFATERVLGALHVIGGVSLCLAAGQKTFAPLMTLMMINGLCYMPTLALTNSIAFRNIPDAEKDFPIIRVWGTIGWVVAGLIVGVLLGQTDSWFFYLAGGAGIVMGLYCFTLPHTPPTATVDAVKDPFGLRALGMLAQPSFLIFAISAFMVCLVLSFYWVGANPYLVETDRPAPAALMTLGQISEIFFMAAMPWFLGVLGLKRTLLIGIFAWVVRYALFGYVGFSFAAVIVALAMHGICYDFFFVAAYIYVDKKAPEDLRASAQSMIALIMLGVGMFVGMKLAGYALDRYPSPHTIAAVDADGKQDDTAPLPAWPTSEPYSGPLRYLDLSTTIKGLLSDEVKQEEVVSLSQQLGSDKENEIAISTVEAIPDELVKLGDLSYRKDDLVTAFRAVDADKNGVVTRGEWRAAKAHDWTSYWTWPIILALVTGVFFLVGFHEKQDDEAKENPAKPE